MVKNVQCQKCGRGRIVVRHAVLVFLPFTILYYSLGNCWIGKRNWMEETASFTVLKPTEFLLFCFFYDIKVLLCSFMILKFFHFLLLFILSHLFLYKTTDTYYSLTPNSIGYFPSHGVYSNQYHSKLEIQESVVNPFFNDQEKHSKLHHEYSSNVQMNSWTNTKFKFIHCLC